MDTAERQNLAREIYKKLANEECFIRDPKPLYIYIRAYCFEEMLQLSEFEVTDIVATVRFFQRNGIPVLADRA